MMAQHNWHGSFVIFQGIRTNIAKKPVILWLFRGGGCPDLLPPPLWIRACSSWQSSRWGRESWLICFIIVLLILFVCVLLSLPFGAIGWFVSCTFDISWPRGYKKNPIVGSPGVIFPYPLHSWMQWVRNGSHLGYRGWKQNMLISTGQEISIPCKNWNAD